jgi:Arc/MetJ-type ribon-helix-helix transcriptional regulator
VNAERGGGKPSPYDEKAFSLRGMQNFAYTLLMSTIRLTPHSEELLQKQLARGPYRSPEEVIERALETLAQKESTPFHPGSAAKSPSEAVADILEIQKRNRLGGLKIKDLIHEGHKY